MKFSKLYESNSKAVKRLLKSLWCSNANTVDQQAYCKQIGDLIDNELFTSEEYIPLVQCMERYPSLPKDKSNEVTTFMNGLWEKSIGKSVNDDKYYTPYIHQWEAWEALSKVQNNMIKQSMVVTTGTGSGKTECFMLPLVKDLINENRKAKSSGKIEALFLYPLNALMEDQKERLHKLLYGTGLTFASYNSNLPKKEFEGDDLSEYEKDVNKSIRAEKEKYPDTIIPTREELHNCPPNILLTNPSMLEYMLMRNNDQHLFTEGSLKWIIIDEAHTYSGAAAIELAMLIRRVLDAFGVKDPYSIRFALSSATIGNEKSKEKREEQLLKFVSDITGVKSNYITPISAERCASKRNEENNELEKCRNKLIENDYMLLTSLINGGNTISEKLEMLDKMCEDEVSPLRVKVHFFYRTPNNGLRVMLNQKEGGIFKVFGKSSKDSEVPALELVRCKKCGNFFAIAQDGTKKDPRNTANEYKYKTLDNSHHDIFNFDEDSAKNKMLMFAIADEKNKLITDNKLCVIGKEKLDTFIERDDDGDLIFNPKLKCPHCASSLSRQSENDDNNAEADEQVKENKIERFRISSELIARALAPSILPHLHEFIPNKKDNSYKPHKGQQYISFVDSRQAAARTTLSQNIEQERIWLYSRVLDLLSNKYKTSQDKKIKIQKELAELEESRDRFDKNSTTWESLNSNIININKSLKEPSYLRWEEIVDGLKDITFPNSTDKEIECLYSQILEEDTEDRNLSLRKYIHLIMKEQLGRHKKNSMCPESMGLFTSYYPKLDSLDRVPVSVEELNLSIDLTDWKNLLKIFLDHRVRGNESFYLKECNNSPIDIFNIERYATVKEKRTQIKKPKINKNGSQLHIVYLIAKVLDESTNDLEKVIKANSDKITIILDALWKDLIDKELITWAQNITSEGWKKEENREEKDEPLYRLNLCDLSFKLYDELYICKSDENNYTPIETLFKGYSPYVLDKNVYKPVETIKRHEKDNWDEELKRVLDKYGIWGEFGHFASILDIIHSQPQIFIQAEHTAQIDKDVARFNQEEFKNRRINILACSTTMEMGVDLGNMELVMMQSIPPHPTNYKQRAGRSGRNEDTRSVAITLCDSSAIGIRTLYNPLATLINRKMSVPSVDTSNKKVIRRHINALLMREFMSSIQHNDISKDRVVNFFTPFILEDKKNNNNRVIGKDVFLMTNDGKKTMIPSDKLGDQSNTLYKEFISWLEDKDLSGDKIIIEKINSLTNNTILENIGSSYFKDCKEDIELCYNGLLEKVKIASDEYQSLSKKYKDKVKDRVLDNSYGWRVYRKYTEILDEKLDSYFANNRFTPNATMPINVISFNKNPRKLWNNRYTIAKNPTYTLREAIAQYAPGNSVVIQNKSIVVAGVEYTGIDLSQKKTGTFDRIYSDGNITVVENNSLPNKQKWSVNYNEELILVKPVMYQPDITKSTTRAVEKNPYTQVSAQLIDVEEWKTDISPNRMIDTRSSKEVGNGRILYYNEGIGFGYAFCIKCGKAVAEVAMVAKALPTAFGDATHNNIRSLANGKIIECKNDKHVYRHVVFGDYIQTDFCEIRIKDTKGQLIKSKTEETKKLLTTIGLLIATEFCEYEGKDRNEVDFVLMPNGHICVFDTNPGGAGYSDKLSNTIIMQSILKSIGERLKRIESKDELIDKYTSRYVNDIDIKIAKDWIQAVLDNYEKVPKGITSIYPGAKVSSRDAIKSEKKEIEKKLFVNGKDFNKWHRKSWIENIEYLSINKPHINIGIDINSKLISPIISEIEKLAGWSLHSILRYDTEIFDQGSLNISESSIYPLLLAENRLYFTDIKEYSYMDSSWAKDGSIYCVVLNEDEIKKLNESLKEINVNINSNSLAKFYIENSSDVNSMNLASIVLQYAYADESARQIFNQFKESIDNNLLEITYIDEYIRNPLSMITIMQFIDGMIEEFGYNGEISVSIIGERYWNSKSSRYFDDEEKEIEQKYEFSDNRDKYFKELIKKWSKGKKKFTVNVKSEDIKTLPHWRELRIKSGKCELVMYPNGGVLNGWKYIGDSVEFCDIDLTKGYSLEQKDHKIMYDIQLLD